MSAQWGPMASVFGPVERRGRRIGMGGGAGGEQRGSVYLNVIKYTCTALGVAVCLSFTLISPLQVHEHAYFFPIKKVFPERILFLFPFFQN